MYCMHAHAVCYAGGRQGLAGQRFETPEAAWDASWKEGQRLVKLYQAELQVILLYPAPTHQADIALCRIIEGVSTSIEALKVWQGRVAQTKVN